MIDKQDTPWHQNTIGFGNKRIHRIEVVQGVIAENQRKACVRKREMLDIPTGTLESCGHVF